MKSRSEMKHFKGNSQKRSNISNSNKMHSKSKQKSKIKSLNKSSTSNQYKLKFARVLQNKDGTYSIKNR